MIQGLEVIVNDPFDASLIEHLFADREDLELTAPRSKYPFCREEWTERFNKHPENCSLIFRLDQKVIGHTSFLPNAEDLYLCYVILDTGHRGKGVIDEMIRHSEEFCRLNYPHTVLNLNVRRFNDRALSVYKRLGYEVFAELTDKLKMRKTL